MLRVEIRPPENSAGWVDHAGNAIGKLVFSKEYLHKYTPGHYPLESLGSLYRNISDFRESPLQSQTDWEIKIPSIYSSGRVQTVDLLHWLEGENEARGKKFDLIGCKAVLLDDEDTVYSGVVESFTSDSIRISDWLGNPKSCEMDFPTALGVSGADKWPVQAAWEKSLVTFKISSRALGKEPALWLKTETGFIKIEGLAPSSDIYYLSNPQRPNYSSDFMTATFAAEGEAIYTLAGSSGMGFSLSLPYSLAEKLRPDHSKDTPDYYAIGDGSELEVLEAWSRNLWWFSNGIDPRERVFSVGRARQGRRFNHPAGSKIRPLSGPSDIGLRVKVQPRAESVVMLYDSHPPYQCGSPSELAWNSSSIEPAAGAEVDFAGCPEIQAYYLTDSGAIQDTGYYRFTVNLACPEITGTARMAPTLRRIFLALDYQSAGSVLEYEASFRMKDLNDDNWIKLPASWADGKIKEFIAQVHNEGIFVEFSKMLKIEFRFRLVVNLFGNKPSDTVLSQLRNIRVGYARAAYEITVPLGSSKIYASGELASPASPAGNAMTVNPLIASLAFMAGRPNACAEGDTNSIAYGSLLDGKAFSLRDKLRSLAAESATLVRLDPSSEKIITSDLSLRKEHVLTRIKPDALALAGNLYSFKMESPDRGELLSGAVIRWGRDAETGKYEHAFSVQAAGIKQDGNDGGASAIPADEWNPVHERMKQNEGIGVVKSVDAEWITSWEAAENMAYNLLRWNTAPMRKAQAACIFTVLGSLRNEAGDPANIDIGSFVAFDLPGHHRKLAETAWIVTGRHDDLDSMETTLELLEVRGMPAVPRDRYLLLEDGGNILTEQSEKLKLEDFYV
jgi:hypothetical protein